MIAKKNKKKSDKKQDFTKYIKWLWLSFAGAVALAGLVFLLASWGVFGEMPTFEHLENPQTNLATEIISSDGETLGKFYLDDNRTPVAFSDLPQHLVEALVATEDERYYNHAGIDARGTVRAFAYLGKKGGASTITQQLARQLFVGIRSKKLFKTATQKIKEWVIATRLERNYTKEEIIAMYLNIYDFGYNADGIRSASRIYFGGKEPKDLKLEESAVLVGMLKNSSLYNPLRRPEMVKERRDVVLRQMYVNDFISEKQKDSLQALEMDINYRPESHNDGPAPYFREYLRSYMAKWIKENPKSDGSKYNIYLDGLKIYTTINSRMQDYAEQAVGKHMKQLQAEFFVQSTPKRNKTAPFLGVTSDEIKRIYERATRQSERWRKMKAAGKSEKEIRTSFDKKTEMTIFTWDGDRDTIMTPRDSIRHYKFYLRAAMMSMEPQTGHVKAWVGGIDYGHFKYDQVIQGARQAGSTFKPFVYTAAVDQLQLSPCDTLLDVHHCIEAEKYGNPEPWCPKNSNGKYSGKMLDLKYSLANSVNSITARLMDRVGPGPVATIARNMGIKGDIPEVPSIALGTPDMTVYEMVGAYGTYANQGVYVKPVMITRIEDKNGTVLFESTPETKDVLSKEVAYVMTEMMKGVTQSGSGQRLRHSWAKNKPEYKEIITGYPYELTNPIAGKTGTTQNQSDGWFMGMVPNLVTGVWVGGDDRATHFRTITYGQGAAMALPIWALYMKKCYGDESLEVSTDDFERPERMTISLDCTTYGEKPEVGVKTEEEELEEIDF